MTQIRKSQPRPTTRTFYMCERSPVEVTLSEWKVIAESARKETTKAGVPYEVLVLRKDDTCIVYAYKLMAGTRIEGGFIATWRAGGEDVAKAVRRVCGIIGMHDVATLVIQQFPSEKL